MPEVVERFLADLLSDGELFLDSDTVGRALSGSRVADAKAAATHGRKEKQSSLCGTDAPIVIPNSNLTTLAGRGRKHPL